MRAHIIQDESLDLRKRIVTLFEHLSTVKVRKGSNRYAWHNKLLIDCQQQYQEGAKRQSTLNIKPVNVGQPSQVGYRGIYDTDCITRPRVACSASPTVKEELFS